MDRHHAFSVKQKEVEILSFIGRKTNKDGYAPSYREIAENTGIKSTSTIHRYVDRLYSVGMLKKEEGKPRTVSIVLGCEPEEQMIESYEVRDIPGLNYRENDILSFIELYTANKGCPPCVRDIGAAVGLKSSYTVHM